jgi:two-component system, LuxR family, sensor kinase FixL
MNHDDLEKLTKKELLAILNGRFANTRKAEYPISFQPSETSVHSNNDSCKFTQLIEEEKIKLGQELHDNLCPQLTCIEMSLHAIRLQVQNSSQIALSQINDLSEVTRAALLQVRTMAAGLTSVGLENQSISQALDHWVKLMDSILPMTLTFSGLQNFTLRDLTAGLHVYRIAQEAVQNAVKHAKANRVNVQLEVDNENLVLIVQDDGIGKIESTMQSNMGSGIRNMRYRSQLLHAQLSFCENVPDGTTVRCDIPSIVDTREK